MLRAVGMGDDDWVKPQIGVASSWNEITPCNLSLDRLAKAAKDGVHAAGGYPLEFGTISVSDGISMGHDGMHFSLVSREVIADSVETVMQAERLDGSVLLAGCDKSLPGMLMAAARLDLASVFLYAGTTLPGKLGDHDINIVDAFEAIGGYLAGRDACESTQSSAPSAPSKAPVRHVHREHNGQRRRGARQYVCRVRRRPAPDRRRDGSAGHRGSRRRPAAQGNHRAPDPRQKAAFDNAIAVVMALAAPERRPAPARDRPRNRVDLDIGDFPTGSATRCPILPT